LYSQRFRAGTLHADILNDGRIVPPPRRDYEGALLRLLPGGEIVDMKLTAKRKAQVAVARRRIRQGKTYILRHYSLLKVEVILRRNTNKVHSSSNHEPAEAAKAVPKQGTATTAAAAAAGRRAAAQHLLSRAGGGVAGGVYELPPQHTPLAEVNPPRHPKNGPPRGNAGCDAGALL
jgi:hypothetical protein